MKTPRAVWAAILLCALTACGRPGGVVPEQPPEPSLEMTPSPALTPTPAPPASPRPFPSPRPSPSPPEPSKEPPTYVVVLPDGVPEKPAYAIDEVGTRWYPEPVSELRPRPDYGPLYPYIGAVVGAPWGGDEPLYGLCTENGRIVTDPVYIHVEIAEKDGKRMYLLQKNVNDGSYQTQRVETTFAAPDGNWAMTYRDCDRRPGMHNELSYIEAAVDPAYISVNDGTGWGAIGYDGKLVYPCKERFPVQFCDGLAAVWSEDGESYSYINLNGQTVLGPFTAPEPLGDDVSYWTFAWQRLYFSHGVARFGVARFKGAVLWGYIDTKGHVIAEPQFTSAYCFYGNYGVATRHEYRGTDEGYTTVNMAISRTGAVLCEVNSYIRPLDRDLFIAHNNHEDNRIINSAGEVVPLSISADGLLKNGWFEESRGFDGTRLEKDGEVIEYPFSITQGLPGDRFIMGYPYGDDKPSWVIVDKAGNLLTERQEGYASLLSSGRIIASIWYGMRREGLWDADLTPLLPMTYQVITEFGDFFAVREGNYGGMLDINGNWVVKRSLLDTIAD